MVNARHEQEGHVKKMLAAVSTVIVGLAGGSTVLAGNAGSGQEAQVTRATLESSWNRQPMTCDEIQIINGNMRKEIFRCNYPLDPPDSTIIRDESNGRWFSDFDGTRAVTVQIEITPSGILQGWATY